jgi:hypothetical protein
LATKFRQISLCKILLFLSLFPGRYSHNFSSEVSDFAQGQVEQHGSLSSLGHIIFSESEQVALLRGRVSGPGDPSGKFRKKLEEAAFLDGQSFLLEHALMTV